MTALVLAGKGLAGGYRNLKFSPLPLGVFLAFAAVAALDSETGAIILGSLSDAYLQVSVFVAATLAAFYLLERYLGIDTAALLAKHRRWQVPVASFLGALPGCGGAVIVITQYVAGRTSFGAVMAALTATMGDAAFLLLAREPLTGLGVFALGLAVGVISGYAVDRLHGPDFLRREPRAEPPVHTVDRRGTNIAAALRLPWLAVMAPGLVLGVLVAFQVDLDAMLGFEGTGPVVWLGAAGAVLSLLMWAAKDTSPCPKSETGCTARVIADTNFVTVWVIAAYLAYELAVHLTGLDLGALFKVWQPFIPLIAVLIGLLPGCGPQVLVTTLYLNGVVPLSAQLGNAISNDGDALLPAMALAPKASLVATVYSAVPALIVAYGTYWLWD